MAAGLAGAVGAEPVPVVVALAPAVIAPMPAVDAVAPAVVGSETEVVEPVETTSPPSSLIPKISAITCGTFPSPSPVITRSKLVKESGAAVTSGPPAIQIAPALRKSRAASSKIWRFHTKTEKQKMARGEVSS